MSIVTKLEYVTFHCVCEHDWVNPKRTFAYSGWHDKENKILYCDYWFAIDNQLYNWEAQHPEEYDVIVLNEKYTKV